MITKITIKNFKSLADFSMPLNQFNCLIGLNGAGKTTVLQALAFIGYLASGKTDFRGWSKKDLITNGSTQRIITFQVELHIKGKTDVSWTGEFTFNNDETVVWSGKYNIDKLRFTEEQIVSLSGHHELHMPHNNPVFPFDTSPNMTYLSLKDNQLSYLDDLPLEAHNMIESMLYRNHTIVKKVSDYNFEGSVLSAFKFSNPTILAVQKELQSLKSLEQLSPNILRHVSQKNDSMGLSGEGLPGFLSSMRESDAKALAETLNDFYPDVQKYEIHRKKFGWKDLLIKEVYFKNPIAADHINDGYLRILAMLSQKYSKASFLLFDEIENGINQELIEKLLKELQNFNGKQVLVTTHSALVLNYLTDEAAQKSVIFLFKNSEGHTHAKKFFEIPEIAEKMQFMAPGQIMSQTELNDLNRKLSEETIKSKDAQ